METTIVTDQKGFAGLESQWNVLLTAGGTGTCHSTFEWLFTWWKHFGRDRQLVLVTTAEAGKLVGLAPFYSEADASGNRTLHFLGEGLSDYADLIVLPERPDITDALMAALLKDHAQWSAVDFEELPEWSVHSSFYERLAAAGGHAVLQGRTVRCPYLPITTTWEDFFSTMGNSFRHDLHNKQNRCLRSGITLQYSSRYTVDSVFLDAVVGLSAKRQLNDEHRSPFVNHPDQEFLRDVLPLMGRHHLLRIGELRNGDALVSFALAFYWNGVVYDWNTQYDPDYQQYSVGRMTLVSLIEQTFREKCREFDFMRGEEAYKFQWTSYTRSNRFVRSAGIE